MRTYSNLLQTTKQNKNCFVFHHPLVGIESAICVVAAMQSCVQVIVAPCGNFVDVLNMNEPDGLRKQELASAFSVVVGGVGGSGVGARVVAIGIDSSSP